MCSLPGDFLNCKASEEEVNEDERRHKQRAAWDYNGRSSDVNSFEVKDPLGLSAISKKVPTRLIINIVTLIPFDDLLYDHSFM